MCIRDRDETQQRVDVRQRELVAEVGGEERQPEVGEVDQPEQAPAQAEAQPEQAVEGTDEDAREDALREQRSARQREARHARANRLSWRAAWRRLRSFPSARPR